MTSNIITGGDISIKIQKYKLNIHDQTINISLQCTIPF